MPDINVNKLSEALNTKADIDLNNTGVFSTSGGRGVNLTSSTPADASGKEVTSADFIKSGIQSNLLNYTTNRILEIPQDIKLELNNGTLALKAGSKVYVPNGVDVFDALTIDSDKTLTVSDNATQLLCINSSNKNMVARRLVNCVSGAVATTTAGFAYNTTTNQVRFFDSTGTGQGTNYSLPLAIITVSNGAISSIDQVFNGFGYIGSTVFALPGVKVQIPNGRNADGTCRSIIATVDSVKTATRTDSLTTSKHWYLSKNLNLTSSSEVSFDADKNIYVSPSGVMAYVEIAHGYLTSGKITSFEPCTVDSVVNSNASNFSQSGRSLLSGLGMPSGRYIDLTLGASGSSYTAPANGWFFIDVGLTGEKGAAQLSCGSIGASAIPQTGVSPSYALLPVYSGNVVKLTYGLSAKFNAFRFIYAEGEN